MLSDEVAGTTARIVENQPEWPCRRGCDHCCRSLSSPMRMTEPEWERLAEGLAELDDGAHSGIRGRLDEPRICALLDRTSGACMVYAARPIACRAYGFYAGRDGGRWCEAVEQRDDLTSSVILGNHDVLESALETLGASRTLADWWREKF